MMTLGEIKRLLDLSEKHSRIRLIKAIHDATRTRAGYDIFIGALKRMEEIDKGISICSCCNGTGRKG